MLEFKNAIKQNTTIENAYKQLTKRYRRDIPKLFRYNAFTVISDGVNNKIGSLFDPYEYFYGWHKAEATDTILDGAFDTMFTMMHGLFRHDRLLDVIHNFIYLPDTPKEEDKILCRYPQYFATRALFDNILKHSRLSADGESIEYGSAGSLTDLLTFDFNEEKKFDYSAVSSVDAIKHIGRFIAGIWQIHAFGEGNTRTTAVFLIKYLRSFGFDVNNKSFEKHSWFFRNALVRSQYENIPKRYTALLSRWRGL